MKVRITFTNPDNYGMIYKTIVYPSIKVAAIACGRAPRILSYKLNHGGPNIVTRYGTIISIEAINGKTDDVGSEVREHTDSTQEDIQVGAVEVRGSWGRIKQALGQATTAVKRYLGKFYKP